jgi:hypothetical protein
MSLSFLSLYFSDLWFLPSHLPFYSTNCFSWANLSFLYWLIVLYFWNVVWFSVRFSFLDAFLIIVSVGIRCIYKYIKCNKKKDNATFKVNKEIIKTTPSPHLLSAVAVEISSPRNHGGWTKIRWWRWMWTSCSKSLNIFVPITSMNTFFFSLVLAVFTV